MLNRLLNDFNIKLNPVAPQETVPSVAIAQAIAIAAMPTFSAQVALGKTEEMRASLATTLRGLLEFLIGARRAGRTVVGYGAPAKGNTLLNYCGVRTDFLDFTVDRSPHKQGRYLPGTRIPILAPEAIFEAKPDYVLILPWNLRDEIATQMAGVRAWGGRFVVAIPRVEVLP